MEIKDLIIYYKNKVNIMQFELEDWIVLPFGREGEKDLENYNKYKEEYLRNKNTLEALQKLQAIFELTEHYKGNPSCLQYQVERVFEGDYVLEDGV